MVWLLTLSRLVRDHQEVTVEAQQHGEARVELPEGRALYEGLEAGGDRGQGERFLLFMERIKKMANQTSMKHLIIKQTVNCNDC